MKRIDKKKIEKAVRDILEALGEDTNREGLLETPERVARMYEEVFEGMMYTNEEIEKKFNKCFSVSNDDMVLVRGIEAFSYCEHHMALIYDMSISVAYIPKGKVIGLSKIARIADMVYKRLQIQERIGSDIAEILSNILGTEDVAVVISAKHSCMSARGIKKQNSTTLTSTMKGQFLRDPSLKKELMGVL